MAHLFNMACSTLAAIKSDSDDLLAHWIEAEMTSTRIYPLQVVFATPGMYLREYGSTAALSVRLSKSPIASEPTMKHLTDGDLRQRALGLDGGEDNQSDI
ncbi:unnamed protein product [Cylicostephanus goldi]|uniref:Uncharacterized protein n=1 Tax=Cylicostephanus goldi TaxID=71465 RepID=A0A3P6QR69_CYLGO|nr:unnamed protein product [Cylicostephanus goldi]